MDHFDTDRIGVHTVVRRPRADRHRADHVVAPVFDQAVPVVMPRIPIAGVMRDLVERNALDDRTVLAHHEMCCHAVVGTVPVINDSERVGVAFGVVKHDVALVVRALRPVAELGTVVFDDAQLRTERLSIGTLFGICARAGFCLGRLRLVRGRAFGVVCGNVRNRLRHDIVDFDRRFRLHRLLRLRLLSLLCGAACKNGKRYRHNPHSGKSTELSPRMHNITQHDAPLSSIRNVRWSEFHIQGYIDRRLTCAANPSLERQAQERLFPSTCLAAERFCRTPWLLCAKSGRKRKEFRVLNPPC